MLYLETFRDPFPPKLFCESVTFLLAQRSIDLSLLLTWMTLAAFLVQITSAPSFFKVPNCFTPFILQNDIFNKNEKPETHHDKPMLV